MKKIYYNLIRNQKGISLIAITVTILVLSIVTSIVVYNAKNNIEIREYKKLANDLEVLQNKIDMYYLKNEQLPVLNINDVPVEYEGPTYYLSQKQSNDNDNYYIIDLNSISGVTLNFGKDFYRINQNASNIDESMTDLYIVNEQSHRIYYAKGIDTGDNKYYTIGKDSEVDIKTINDLNGSIEINMKLFSIDSNLEISNLVVKSETFNVGIFLDENGTVPAFENYNKKAKIERTNSAIISYDNIPEGTYYIFELDENGNPLISNETVEIKTNTSMYYNFESNTNKVVVQNKSHEKVILNNIFVKIPEGF